MAVYLGVDGGGTKTALLLIDGEGRVLAHGVGEGANPNDIGMAAARERLATLLRAVLPDMRMEIEGVYAGMSGAATSGTARELQAFLHLTLPGARRVRVTSDAFNGLYALFGDCDGLSVIAGTGSAAFVKKGGRSWQIGAWGYLLDDAGSGFSIGREVLCAVLREGDGRGAKTLLTELCAEKLGAPVEERIDEIYRGGKRFVASFAPLAFAARGAGDDLAAEIVDRAAEALAELIRTGAKHLEPPFPVALSGGLWQAAGFYEAVRERAGELPLTVVARPPVVGCAAAAAAMGGLDAQAVAQAIKLPEEAVEMPRTETILSGAPSTEGVDPRSAGLDELSPLAFVRLMNEFNREAVAAVEEAAPAIARAIEAVTARLKRGGRLFYIGAGTSGRLGVLDASECPPTFGVPDSLVVGLIAGGDGALRRSAEGAEDEWDGAEPALRAHNFAGGDVLVAISASGGAAYCLGALRYARGAGALTVSIACNREAKISREADIAIEAPTGPEILAGSTRLKAGTATKLILNALSTGVMAGLGKVYKNFMVDMRPGNDKLRDRAIRIVMRAANLDRPAALALYQQADGSVKTAIVMRESGRPAEDCRRALKDNAGYVAKAIRQLRGEA